MAPARPLTFASRAPIIFARPLFSRGPLALPSSHQRAMLKWVPPLRSTPAARKCPMDFHLTPQQRYRLRRTRDSARDAGLFRRTLALLQLDQGLSVATVAAELGVTRQSIYNWLDRYLLAPTPRALRDDRGHGHVTAWDDDLLAVLRSALERPPGDWGYRDLEWTVALLQEHLARWDGRSWSERTVRRQLHQLGYVWKRPRYVLQPDRYRARKIRRIRQRIRDLEPRTALLFEDETDLLLFPPLRACWAKRGESAEVVLSGQNARRVIFGAINVRTGHRLLLPRPRQRAEDFQAFLSWIHDHYRSRPVWLLLDGDSSHTAHGSVGLARELGIGLIGLPKRCPELNPVDHLWGHAKDEVCANHQEPSIDHLVDRFIRYIHSLSPEEARRKAGILSEDFWLREECQI
jgi:transposase